MDCYKLRDGKDAIDLTRAVFDMKKDHYINLYMDNLPEIYHKLARYRSMKISTLTTEKTIYDLGKYNIENEIDKLWNISNRQYCIAYERSGLKEETLKMVSECYDRGKVGDYEFLTILME